MPVLAPIIDELNERIENEKDLKPPLNSHASGVIVGLMEARDLLVQRWVDE